MNSLENFCGNHLAQAQATKREEMLSRLRKPQVKNKIIGSNEWRSINYIHEKFIPDLKRLVVEVSIQMKTMRSNVDEFAPFCRHYLLSIGCTVQLTDPYPKSILNCRHEEVLRSTSQVLHLQDVLN